MAKGSTGTNTGMIIYRRQKPVPCRCLECKNLRVVDGDKICMATGDYLLHVKKTCLYYSGKPIRNRKSKRKAKMKNKSK